MAAEMDVFRLQRALLDYIVCPENLFQSMILALVIWWLRTDWSVQAQMFLVYLVALI